MSECCKEEKEITGIKYKISLVQDDKEVIDVIINEDKLEDTFNTLKHGNVLWHDNKGVWVNNSRIRYALVEKMNIAPDPEDGIKEDLHEGVEKHIEMDTSDA